MRSCPVRRSTACSHSVAVSARTSAGCSRRAAGSDPAFFVVFPTHPGLRLARAHLLAGAGRDRARALHRLPLPGVPFRTRGLRPPVPPGGAGGRSRSLAQRRRLPATGRRRRRRLGPRQPSPHGGNARARRAFTEPAMRGFVSSRTSRCADDRTGSRRPERRRVAQRVRDVATPGQRSLSELTRGRSSLWGRGHSIRMIARGSRRSQRLPLDRSSEHVTVEVERDRRDPVGKPWIADDLAVANVQAEQGSQR
jgi:hypothetical protein